CEQYQAAAEAYLRGIERRVAAGLDPKVQSVASIFVSRWDAAVQDKVAEPLRNRLGIAVARRTYRAYRELLDTARWRKLAAAGAAPQRVLWASTGTKDPKAPDTLYIEALAAPGTVNTMPEATLLAFADHGKVNGPMPADGGDADALLAQFAHSQVEQGPIAAQLQRDGARSFTKSWTDLLACLASKSAQLTQADPAAVSQR
ncbi:MAG TPA: transaldolase family protein, partial [Steroidobacteraceae bacterium]